MSGNTPYYTLHEAGPVPAQASQAQGNRPAMNRVAVPRTMMANQQHPQYQQQQQQHFQEYHQRQQPHYAGSPHWNADGTGEHTVVEKSDLRHERKTESEMRESLSEFIIYRLVMAPGEHDDDEGCAAPPTWENVIRKRVHGMSKPKAAQRVQELNGRKSVEERSEQLIDAQEQQIDRLQDDLQKREKDRDYYYVLEQFDQKTEKIPYEEYLRDKRNLDRLDEKELKMAMQLMERDKSRKKYSSNFTKTRHLKDKEEKLGHKRVTTSITVFYKRKPRPDADVATMYQKMARSGRAPQPRESVERAYQKHHEDLPLHDQQLQSHGLQQPQHHQQPRYSQQYASQQQQYPQQQQQNPQQQYQTLPQQAQQQPRSIQEAQIPIPPKTPLPAVPRDQGKPIVIPHGSAQKLKSEPVEVIKASPATKKNKPREKHYHINSARSSRSSIYSEDDIFSVDSETTRSSMPSDVLGDKRGRTKKKGKSRRGRSESTDGSRSRPRGRDRSRRESRNRPELYGVRQHTVGEYGRYGSPPLGGVGRSVPTISTERNSVSPEALKTIFNLGKMEGHKEASCMGFDEPVSPRVINAKRLVMRDSEEDFDDVWVGNKVYERRNYDRHDGSGGRPHEKVHQQPQPMPRAPGNQFRPPPAHAYDRGYLSAASDDYSEEYNYQYTHTPAPQARPQPQSPERRGYEQAFRRPQYAEEPYMSGGLQDRVEVPREENPFKPMPRR